MSVVNKLADAFKNARTAIIGSLTPKAKPPAHFHSNVHKHLGLCEKTGKPAEPKV